MNFIRPEVAQLLYRWRDAFAGLAVALAGFWWAQRSFGGSSAVGWGVGILGIALTWAGAQRARFRSGGEGPGVVTVDERRLVYYGPLSGGVLDLDELSMLAFDPATPAGPCWVLTAAGETLWIPLGATGIDALFDAFSAMPDLPTHKILDVLSRTPPAQVVLWRRGALRVH